MDEHEQIFKELQRPEGPPMSTRTRALGLALGAAKTILPVGKTLGETGSNIWHMLIDPIFKSDSEMAAQSRAFGKKVESGDPEATGSFLTQILGLGFANRLGDVEPAPVRPKVGPPSQSFLDMLAGVGRGPEALEALERKPLNAAWAPDAAEMSAERAKEIGEFDNWMANVEKPHLSESHGHVTMTPTEVQRLWDKAYPVEYRHPGRGQLGTDLPPIPGHTEWYGESQRIIRDPTTGEVSYEPVPAKNPPIGEVRQNLSWAMGEEGPGGQAQAEMARWGRMEKRMNDALRSTFMREDRIEPAGVRNVDKIANLLGYLRKLGVSKQ